MGDKISVFIKQKSQLLGGGVRWNKWCGVGRGGP